MKTTKDMRWLHTNTYLELSELGGWNEGKLEGWEVYSLKWYLSINLVKIKDYMVTFKIMLRLKGAYG